MLAHNVYFTLKDKSAPSRNALVAACRKYLVAHPGVVFFACGTLQEGLDRPVNDRDFDVALHVVFESKEAHDLYQEAPLHLKFVEENREGWAKVPGLRLQRRVGLSLESVPEGRRGINRQRRQGRQERRERRERGRKRREWKVG